MAQRGEDITTRFKVDISDLKKGISQARKQIQLANAQFKSATAGMDDWKNSSEGLTAKLKQLQSILTSEKSKLDSYRKQYIEVGKAYQENKNRADELRAKLQQLANQGVSKTSEEYKKYKKALTEVEKEQLANKNTMDSLRITYENQKGTVNGVNREIRNYTATLDTFETEARQAENAADNLNDELNESDRAARNAGQGFTVFKGALSSLLADGIRKVAQGLTDMMKTAIEYESAFTNVKKTVNGTDKELAQLDSDIRKMAKTMPQSASDIAEVAAAAGQLGVKTNDIADFTKTMIMLGDSTNLTSEDAASALAQFASVVNMSADDYSKLGSTIVALGNNFATTEADIVNMGTRLASAGSQVGMSEANIMSLAAALSSVGLEAEGGGTAFSKLLINMQVATETGGKKLEDFAEVAGMSSKEFKKAFQEDATGALQKFIAGLADSEKSGKSAVGVLTDMGIKETRLRDSILRAVGAKDLFTDAIKTGEKAWKEDTALSKEATQRYKTTASKIQIMKNNFTDLGLTLFDKLQPTIQKVIESLTKLANNEKALKKLATAAKLFVAALAIAKFNKWTTSLSTAVKTSTLLNAILRRNTTATIANTTATTAGTVATSAGTVATKLFNAAWKANPIGLVVTVVAALAAGIYALVKATKKSTEETDKNAIATKKLKAEQDELTKSLKENKKAREEGITSAQEEAGTTDFLMDKLSKLSEVENKTNDQKATMKRLVTQLNAIMPNLKLRYDEEKDALNKSTQAIKEYIVAQKDLILAKAAEENLSAIARDIAAQEIEQGKLIEQNTKNEKEYLAAKQKLQEFTDKYSAQDIAYNTTLHQQYDELIADEAHKETAYNKSNKALQESKDNLKNLNDEYSKTNEYVSKMYKDVEIQEGLAKLTDLAKAKGREIPEALANGMKEGNYAVPTSIKELDKLIEFDEAVKNAGLAGLEIPSSISQGVLNGKTSVQDAITQIKDTVTFSDTLAKAKQAGVIIPNNLAQNMLEGTISIKDAITQLNDAVTYDEMVNKAGIEGTKLVNSLTAQIKNGKMLPKQAIEEINALTTYDKLIEKASSNGVKIPQAIEDGIISGKTKPSEAVAQINALISYKNALNKAKLNGANVPEYFSKAIANGDIKVENANAAMNRLIQFQSALEKAGKGGIEIPDTLASNIANGKTTVKNATSQMNNWIKFQTAIDSAGLAGADIPDDLASGVLSGKIDVKTAITKLNNTMKEEAKKSKEAGENLIEGTKQGIQNPKKQSSVFSAISNFGSSILKKLQNSLKEKSPSKATNQMGQYLIVGLGNGLAKKENSVIKQIGKIGTNVLKSFKKANDNNQYEKAGTTAINSFKQGVNNQVKSSTDSVKTMVNKTVNALTKQNKKVASQYKKAGTAVTSAYSTAIKDGAAKAITATENMINSISGKFQTQYDEIADSRKSLKDLLSNDKALYTESDSGKIILTNLKQTTAGIQAYGKNLEKLKKKLPEGLMQEILGMSEEEGSKYTNALLKLSSKELTQYVKDYNQHEKAAKSISDKYYSKELSSLETSFNKQVTGKLETLEDKLSTIGSNAMSGLISGMKSQKSSLTDTAKSMASTIVETLKKELKIHSPSKVMESLAEFIPEGLKIGIVNKTKSVVDSVKTMSQEAVMASRNMLSGMNVPALATAGNSGTTTTNNVVNNYSQVINAPKQPSRIEIYRDTRNLLNLKGGN